jgi:uncharacterized protein YkwD
MRFQRTFSVVLAAAVATSGATLATGFIHPQAAQAAVTADETQQAVQLILEQTNQARVANGLKPLVLNDGISKVSQAWSQEQANRGAMQHNPDYAFQIPAGWNSAGENVAMGQRYEDVVAAWMNSAGHRANILGDYTDIGIGYYVDANGTTWFTQNFAKYPPFTLNPVSNATFFNTGEDHFGVRWSSPTTNGVINNYTVRIFDANGNSIPGQAPVTTEANSASFTNLNPSTKYLVQISVNATNGGGTETRNVGSGIFSYTTPDKAPVYTGDQVAVAPVTNIAVKPAQDTAAISWTAPQVTGTLNPYIVSIYKEDGTLARKFVTTGTSINANGLVAGTNYKLVITSEAYSPDGTAIASNTAQTTFTTAKSVTDNVAVSAVQKLSVSSPNQSTVSASWASPATVTGSITKYTATITGPNRYSKTVNVTGTSVDFTGLAASSQYTVKVTATAVSDSGVKTATSTAVSANVTTQRALSDKVGVSSVQKLSVKAPNNSTVTASWAKPASITGTLTGYSATITGPNRYSKTVNVSSGTGSVSFTGLTENAKYTVKVTASAVSESGKKTAISTAASANVTTPFSDASKVGVSAPQSISAGVSRYNATVRWNAPKSVTGSVQKYTLTVTGKSYSKTWTTTSRAVAVSGLKPNQTYTAKVTVTAKSANGKYAAVNFASKSFKTNR